MMTEKLNAAEQKIVLGYIDKIDEGLREFNSGLSSSVELTNILLEVLESIKFLIKKITLLHDFMVS